MSAVISVIAIIAIIVCVVYASNVKKKENEIASNYNKAAKQLKAANKAVQEAEDKMKMAENKQRELEISRRYSDERVAQAEEKYNNLLRKYKEESSKSQEELDKFFAAQRNTRQSELDTEFENLRRANELKLRSEFVNQKTQLDDALAKELERVEKTKEAAIHSQDSILADTQFQQQRFEALLEPLKKYEMDKQALLFYTIQVPDEYKEDINFLVTTVSQKVQHPDIINKLVWAEYVKPYLDETIKRAGIEDKPGIYKITSIETGKCYVGKSTNIKKRIQDHFKSAIGISTIADQAVHHEIWRSGFWNWTIEPIIYCDKDELSDLEKYYIDFFKAQEFGYNRKGGG